MTNTPEDDAALRARIQDLESQLAARRTEEGTARQAEGERHHVRGLSVLSGILVVLACVLAPLSVVSVWADRIISDTDQYVETVAPLAEQPEVRAAVADQVTTAVLANLDVDKVTGDALDALASQDNVPRAAAAAIPGLRAALVNGIEGFVRDQVVRILATPEFATVWAQVNRTAHEQVVNLLEGNQGGAVTTEGNAVTLDLAPVVAEVRTQLVDQGFSLADRIPTVHKSFVLVQSDSVTKAQWAYRALNTLGTWLPVIALALLVVGVLLARDSRRALLRGGLGLAASMIVLGAALAIARTWYVNETPADVLTSGAAGEVFDTLVRFLRTGLRAVGVFGLVLAIAAFLSGSSTAAVGVRRGFTQGIGSLRHGAEAAGWQTGRVGSWTFAHRMALRITAAVLAGLLLMFWSRPSAWVVLGIALLFVLVLAVIEFVGRPPAAHA